MKALIKTTVPIREAELDEVRELFPDVIFTVRTITDKPVPTWNPYFKLIEIDWPWFRGLFGSTEYDIHCYVTTKQNLKDAAITKYTGLYSLDADARHEFWFGIHDRLLSTTKNNGFKSNFAYLFVHELMHGKQHFAKQKDTVHTMVDQGRLKELALSFSTQPNRPELLKKKVSLAEQLKTLLVRILKGRYQRPLPNHWDRITQEYLNYDPVTYKATGYHPGTDFAAPLYTPILAPDDGEITRSWYTTSLGNWVEFRFGNLYLIALHLSNVQPPRKVKRGEPIGFVGDTGMINGVHAHLEVWARPMDRSILTSREILEAVTLDITELM